MAGVNKAIILGHLGSDPHLSTMNSGEQTASLSIATSKKWQDQRTGEMRERTEWHRVVLYRRLAEIAGEYLKKGSQVYIEGELQTRKWTDRDGIDRYTTEIIADSLQLLGRKDEKTNAPDKEKNGTQGVENNTSDDDIPF